MPRSFLLPLLLFVLLAGAGSSDARAADEPWETNVRAAIEEQDGELTTARRRGSLEGVATRYASRAARQPTALNHFLKGRVLYFLDDKPGAERALRESLAAEPRFWFSRLRLAMLEIERDDLSQAERYVNDVLRVKPREPDALKLLAQIRMTEKDWDGALRALELLLSLDPSDLDIRKSITMCHIEKGDWQTALGELRALRGRDRNDLQIRFYYGVALFETGDVVEAARELEALLLKIPEPDLRVLDLLKVAYARQEDWKNVQRTIERMLPHVPPEGEFREQLDAQLADLRAGRTPGQAPRVSDEQLEAQRQMKELIDRTMVPEDAVTRRRALQDWYEAGIPMLPSDIARRILPDLEPDPTCRKWILRIMGKLQNASLAHLAAFGLYDPDPGVQVVAAESLGDIGTPSGILYLLPFFLGTKLEGVPTQTQVQRLNAAREALIRLTARPDVMGGDGVWVGAEDIARMRDDWQVWLAGPAGVVQRVEAIQDLGRHGEDQPQLYLMEDIQDPEPRIARAAYAVLRARAEEGVEEGDETVAATMWPRFPRFSEAQLEGQGLARMRQEVQAWWEAWLQLRAQGRR